MRSRPCDGVRRLRRGRPDGRGVAAVSRRHGRRRRRTIPTCPTPGARPATSPGWPRCPDLGWSSPVVWGDHVFVTSVVNTAQQEPPKPGFYLGDWPASTAPHRWMVYDFDYRTGALRWERQVSAAPPAAAQAPEEQLRLGNAGHRRRARLLLLRRRRRCSPSTSTARPLWSRPMGRVKTRNNWGAGGSPALHGGRLYVVNDNDTQSFLAAFDARTGASCGGSTARRAPTGPRRSCGSTRSAPRS